MQGKAKYSFQTVEDAAKCVKDLAETVELICKTFRNTTSGLLPFLQKPNIRT
jgi:hypothetical protein